MKWYTECCELLSKLYFSLSLTANERFYILVLALWIAFKIVFFAVVDSNISIPPHYQQVVNCFQNCIFRCRWQPVPYKHKQGAGCELLSKLYFSLSLTANNCKLLGMYSLWIAFKIVFFAVVDSDRQFATIVELVVNCFQNCIFRCRWQLQQCYLLWQMRCELLSKLYFSLSLTATTLRDIVIIALWIAFKIVFFAVVDSVKHLKHHS